MDLMHYYSMSSNTINILHRLEIKANVDWSKWAFWRRYGWIMFRNIHFMLVFISSILSSMENQHKNETWNVLSYWLVSSIIPGPISYHGNCTVYHGKSCSSYGEGITKGNQFNNVTDNNWPCSRPQLLRLSRTSSSSTRSPTSGASHSKETCLVPVISIQF